MTEPAAKRNRVASRIAELVRERNRELAVDAVLKAFFGVLFSVITFGFVFWLAWFFTCAWQLGAGVTFFFLAVATWSAWKRVDPLAGLQPLTEQQQLAILVGQAAGLAVFSPRHATAGAAVVLLGGPAGVIEAFAIWAHRLRADASIIEGAARILEKSKKSYPINDMNDLAAALLLRCLALVKIVPYGDDDGSALTLTEKGNAVLGASKL